MPSKATIWRVLTGADAAQVDAVVGGWLAGWLANRAGIAIGPQPPMPAEASSGPTQADASPRTVLAVDGKRIRGAADDQSNAPHLLAAATHHGGLVLAQGDGVG